MPVFCGFSSVDYRFTGPAKVLIGDQGQVSSGRQNASRRPTRGDRVLWYKYANKEEECRPTRKILR